MYKVRPGQRTNGSCLADYGGGNINCVGGQCAQKEKPLLTYSAPRKCSKENFEQ
jgi:hypothetical protein